jgi:phage gp46-like protein
MSDIASFWNVDEMFADWQKGLGELTTGNDLQTAILDSLFTDRLARADDDYEDSDRRGWWGIPGGIPTGIPAVAATAEKLTPDVAKKRRNTRVKRSTG